MDNVVILGAGFGGLTLASELNDLAKAGKADVTLVDQNTHFSMGFSMQWVLAGRREAGEGQRPYTALSADHVKFVRDEIITIDTKNSTVQTKKHRILYDYLVIALGAELAPELLPGLAEAGLNLCDMQHVLKLKGAVGSIKSGTIAIIISSTPFKCPPMPYEYAFLIDDILRKRGVRENVRIVLTTPEPQPMPVAGKAVGDALKTMLAEKGIEYLPQHKPKAIDAQDHKVTYENGFELSFDILGAVPPHRAPKVVREAGLADASGFVPVDLYTLKTSVENVYALGDVAALKLPNGNSHPKAGVLAEAQASALARSMIAAIEGGKAIAYDGTGVCYIDAGNEEAAPVEVDLLAPEGPKITLSPPSKEGLETKRRFERERLDRWFGTY